jgi:trypsin-like peptidase
LFTGLWFEDWETCILDRVQGKERLNLLKTFWGRRNDGVSYIAAMQGIELKGKLEADPEFFAVKDDLVLTQAPSIGTIRSVMGESIVPIVAHVPGQNTLRCVGTGFFVSCSGLLITAAHVITDPMDRKYGNVSELDDLTWYTQKLNFGVMVPNNPLMQRFGYHFFPFEWSMFLAERRPNPLPFMGIDLKLTSDIAICKVPQRQDGLSHQPLTMVQRGVQGIGMTVGTAVSAVGYPGMSDVELAQAENGDIVGDYNFRLHVSSGAILERFPDNLDKKEVPTPGPCFSFEARIPGGMSGGPIFDREGIYVHGVVSKGWEDEEGPARYSFGSMLGPSLSLPISRMNGATLLQLQASSSEGIPKFSAPGV